MASGKSGVLQAIADRDGEMVSAPGARLWSVVDGKLLDVRRRDGVVTPIERPAGSVAAKLQWALVGAVDVVGEVSADLSSES